MKKIFTLVIALGAMYSAQAGNNNNDSKFTLGVSAGAALPIGAGNYGMYAQTGFHFDVTAASYLFTGNIGGMVYIGENMNSFDNATFMSKNGITSPETFTSKGYDVGQYLVGPFISLPASDKLKVTIHVLAGIVTANMPTETYKNEFGTHDTETVSGNGGIGLGYQFGAGLKFNLSDKIGLTFNVAYTGASISYTGYTDNQIGSSQSGLPFNYSKTYSAKSTMPIGLLTTTVGLAFNL